MRHLIPRELTASGLSVCQVWHASGLKTMIEAPKRSADWRRARLLPLCIGFLACLEQSCPSQSRVLFASGPPSSFGPLDPRGTRLPLFLRPAISANCRDSDPPNRSDGNMKHRITRPGFLKVFSPAIVATLIYDRPLVPGLSTICFISALPLSYPLVEVPAAL